MLVWLLFKAAVLVVRGFGGGGVHPTPAPPSTPAPDLVFLGFGAGGLFTDAFRSPAMFVPASCVVRFASLSKLAISASNTVQVDAVQFQTLQNFSTHYYTLVWKL